MEEGVRIVEFLDWFTLLLGFVVVLAMGLLPFIGIGLVTYYGLRGRVARRVLRALVVGVPFAAFFGYALVVGFAVLLIQIISR